MGTTSRTDANTSYNHCSYCSRDSGHLGTQDSALQRSLSDGLLRGQCI
jgi:hypothetical protein